MGLARLLELCRAGYYLWVRAAGGGRRAAHVDLMVSLRYEVIIDEQEISLLRDK
ncbi:MAG: hypothetical protein WCD43_00905 [Candidatus Acidiferrales bacterium]